MQDIKISVAAMIVLGFVVCYNYELMTQVFIIRTYKEGRIRGYVDGKRNSLRRGAEFNENTRVVGGLIHNDEGNYSFHKFTRLKEVSPVSTVATKTIDFISQTAQQTKKKVKTIFISLGLYGSEEMRSIPRGYKFTEVDGSKCPVNHCQITYDKNKANSTDAIFFDGRIIHEIDRNVLQKLRLESASQVWIWLMHENPNFTYYNVSDYDNFFNWSATYSPSSDIYTPYFGMWKLSELERKQVRAKNFAEGKDKKVLIVVSHCDDYRMEMIRSLQRFIDVDIYGGCKVNTSLPDCVGDSEECEKLNARYKFYFAIENLYCKDYVTEKYYRNGLIRHIVPVVLNRGNYSNTDVFIPGSYINIQDFSNMESLGRYLNYLDNNDTAYNKYHDWSNTYNVGLRHGMCKVCKALWEHDSQPSQKTLKLSEFWGVNTNCRSYKEKMFQKYLV